MSKIAIVTGASSGMGKELLLRLQQSYELDEIWGIARRKEKLEELKPLSAIPTRPISLDLQKEESMDKIKELLEAEKPNVKLLIHAAGYGKFGTFEEIPLEHNLGMLDLNARALVEITYLVLPYMKEKAQILTVDSFSSFAPIPHVNVYAATKAFVLSFTRSLNQELKPRKIHCIALCPYWVKTEFLDVADSETKLRNLDKVYTVDFVVGKAMKALKKNNRDYIVPGWYAKFLHALTKLLPHKMVMWVWNKQQKFQ